MRSDVPKPLPIDWTCKSVSSARSGVDILPDGRIHCRIEHETISGVTPAMLVWWFSHLEGNVEVDGIAYDRYRVWHPRDHIFAHYERRLDDGSVGVGAVIHLAEVFDGRKEYLIHIRTTITKLDETGYIHEPRIHGLKLAQMRYEFEEVAGGTKYVNSLTVGVCGVLGRFINPLIRRFVFDRKRGDAWIKHNVEEVGNFESFLPKLYRENTAV